MRLTVKILNGRECTIVASPNSLVSDVKNQVELLMSIPVSDQKLLYKGKALMDGKVIGDYGLEDSSKITLVVKKSNPEISSPSVPVPASAPVTKQAEPEKPVWAKLRTFLRRHFLEKDVDLVLEEFKKEFERNLSSLSLDDIERLAMTKLNQS